MHCSDRALLVRPCTANGNWDCKPACLATRLAQSSDTASSLAYCLNALQQWLLEPTPYHASHVSHSLGQHVAAAQAHASCVQTSRLTRWQCS